MTHLYLIFLLGAVMLGAVMLLDENKLDIASVFKSKDETNSADSSLLMDSHYEAVPPRMDLEFSLWPRPSNDFVPN